jgi:hypothetical protein
MIIVGAAWLRNDFWMLLPYNDGRWLFHVEDMFRHGEFAEGFLGEVQYWQNCQYAGGYLALDECDL